MKTYRFDHLKSLDGLREHEEPRPQPRRGEVLVEVKAVSLNYRDVSIVRGDYPLSVRPRLIPTSDGAGEVVAVGDEVTGWQAGDRVMGIFHPRWFGGLPPATINDDSYGSGRDGWLAEYKLVDQEALVRVPHGLSLEAAATLPCAAATAWNALGGGKPIRAGDTVLTLGTGGVSIFAVQLAKALGARVIATTSSDAKGERLKALGADALLNYRNVADWGDRVRELTGGRGVDRVIEVGGPATLKHSLRAVAVGGELVLIGFLTKDDLGIDYFALLGSSATVRPVMVGDRTILENVSRVVSAVGLQPVVDRVFPFAEARDAFEHLDGGRHFGKLVISLP